MSWQTKKHERYWRERPFDEFSSYERNWVVPFFFNPRERVLDLAGGDGSVAVFLQQKLGCRVSLVDGSGSAVKKAKLRGVSDSVVVDLESEPLPYPKREFDVVFWGDNIEHLYAPGVVAREVYRVLKTDGRLVISTPNMGYWRYRMHYLIHGNIPRTEWAEEHLWESQHIRFFNVALLRELLDEHNFNLTRIRGVTRRKIDKYLAQVYPQLFSMILVVEGRKR